LSANDCLERDADNLPVFFNQGLRPRPSSEVVRGVDMKTKIIFVTIFLAIIISACAPRKHHSFDQESSDIQHLNEEMMRLSKDIDHSKLKMQKVKPLSSAPAYYYNELQLIEFAQYINLIDAQYDTGWRPGIPFILDGILIQILGEISEDDPEFGKNIYEIARNMELHSYMADELRKAFNFPEQTKVIFKTTRESMRDTVNAMRKLSAGEQPSQEAANIRIVDSAFGRFVRPAGLSLGSKFQIQFSCSIMMTHVSGPNVGQSESYQDAVMFSTGAYSKEDWINNDGEIFKTEIKEVLTKFTAYIHDKLAPIFIQS
jgi:outer membrane murein-binding lipoprotein Lpp